MEKERKQLQLQAKAFDMEETGSFKAVFATLGVIDHHGDIIVSGSTPRKAVKISSYNHSSWGNSLPVGKGEVYESNGELIVDGKFFMDTQAGSETYKTVKNLGDLGEWSFGFDILDSSSDTIDGKNVRKLTKLDIFEVSPVLMGAGINTRTTSIKSKEQEGAESKTYHDHAEIVMASVADFVKRSQSIADLRQEDGKEPVSEKNREKLKALSADMRKAADEIDRILSTSEEDDEEIKAIMSFLAAQGEFITGGTI